MPGSSISRWNQPLLWGLTAGLVLVPVTLAALSPLQSGREFTYVIGALAGVLALSLLFVQPLLAAGFLSGLMPSIEKRWHRRLGVVLVSAVGLHILGLYLASPDDMSDALMLVAPTPFSLYGVIALLAVALLGLSAVIRPRLRSRLWLWKVAHSSLALIVVSASIVHAWMIDGTMNGLSKIISCVCIALATVAALVYLNRIKPAARDR